MDFFHLMPEEAEIIWPVARQMLAAFFKRPDELGEGLSLRGIAGDINQQLTAEAQKLVDPSEHPKILDSHFLWTKAKEREDEGFTIGDEKLSLTWRVSVQTSKSPF